MKLVVKDEIENGLSYFIRTFLAQVPRVYDGWDRVFAAHVPDWDKQPELVRLPSFLRIGSWIGGDRDGNPFVTADVMRGTLKLQSSKVLRFYLE